MGNKRFLMLFMFFLTIAYIYPERSINKNEFKILNFGEPPWDKAEKLKDFHSRFLVYLSEQLGIEVVLNITPDYGTLQKDLESGDLQIAAFPPGAYADALVSIPDKIRYLATIKRRGNYFYMGYIFSLKENVVDNILKMKGKSIAFNDYGSSSGYKYPFAIFLDRGIEPNLFFSKIFYLGSHNNVLKGVFNRRVDFGATYDRVYDLFQKEHENPFKIIKSYKIPYGVFAASKNISKKLFLRIREALIKLNNETKLKNGKLVLKNDYYLSGFIVKDNSIYDSVVKIAKIIDEYQKKHKY